MWDIYHPARPGPQCVQSLPAQALAPARLASARVLWVYIKRWFQRERFYELHGDDTSQLGGDFLVDRNGLLQFLHPSHDPTDRPEVGDLLQVIKSLPG